MHFTFFNTEPCARRNADCITDKTYPVCEYKISSNKYFCAKKANFPSSTGNLLSFSKYIFLLFIVLFLFFFLQYLINKLNQFNHHSFLEIIKPFVLYAAGAVYGCSQSQPCPSQFPTCLSTSSSETICGKLI